MMERIQKPHPDVEVIPAGPEQISVVGNLLELYAHDFSEFHSVEIGSNGRFGYESLPLYWSEPERHPFLIWAHGRLVGLALVKKGSQAFGNQSVWDMAEFFVLRGYRRRGIGVQAAHHIWTRFPGSWEVRVMQSNVTAQDFWTRAISAFTGTTIPPICAEADGKSWRIFTFESRKYAAISKAPQLPPDD